MNQIKAKNGIYDSPKKSATTKSVASAKQHLSTKFSSTKLVKEGVIISSNLIARG